MSSTKRQPRVLKDKAGSGKAPFFSTLESGLSSLSIEDDIERPGADSQLRTFGASGRNANGPTTFSFERSPESVPPVPPVVSQQPFTFSFSPPSRADPPTPAVSSQEPGFLTPPRATGSNLRCFGGIGTENTSPSTFTFRALYNASPSPSPVPQNKSGPSLQTQAGAEAEGDSKGYTAYDVQSEQPPDDALFFTRHFQGQLARGVGVARKLAEEFVHARRSDGNNVYHLRQDARKLRDFQASDTRTIAFLGDSGEGKSSVINSLLHCSGIAETSDAGMACTSVITEFRHRRPQQIVPFAIEVEYLSESNIEETAQELLWSYSQFYLPDVERDLSGEDYKKCQEESAVAWSTLRAAFDNQPEFKEDLFRDTTDEGQKKALQLVLQWTRDLDWPEGGSDGLWAGTAETAEECREITRSLMQNRIWPFTRVIRIFLSAQVLKTGIVLADLPGLRDTNLAKVRATEKYLLNSDHIFIVAKISRAISDQSLKSSLYTALAQHIPQEWGSSGGQSLSVSVVCTRTEEINFSSLKHQFVGAGKPVSSAQLKDLDDRIKETKGQGDAAAKKQLKRERDLLLINARNDFVKEGLRREYAKKVENKRLEVFCVSNHYYEKHSRKGRTNLVEASGIPELRRFCHSLIAQAQLEESKNFLLAKLPNLVASTKLWMERTSEDQAGARQNEKKQEEALSLIAGLEDKVRTQLRARTKEFRSDIEEQLLQFIDKCNVKWETEALSRSNKWTSWHWSQYNAWCLHNGHHYTEKRGEVNWNSEIIWKMRSELAFQWELVEGEIPTLFEDALDIVRKAIDEIKDFLTTHNATATLSDSIRPRLQDFKYELQRVQRDTKRDFEVIKRNASEDNYNSYVLRCMLSAYRSASQESGTGKNRRQIARVQGQIGNGNLFPSMGVLVSKDLECFSMQTEKHIEKLAGDALESIKRDVSIAYGPHAPREARSATTSAAVDGTQQTLKLAKKLENIVPRLEKELAGIAGSLKASYRRSHVPNLFTP